MITGFALGLASSLIMLLGVFVLAQGLKRGGLNDRRARMQRTAQRLQQAVAELLARADELDQDLKFSGGTASASVSQLLAKTCEDLVLLQDAVKVIENRIASSNLKNAQEDILISLDVARKISTDLSQLRQEISQKRLPG